MTTPTPDIDWLLTDFLKRTGATGVLVTSSDGLKRGAVGLDPDEADHFAAITSGVHSLAKGASKSFGLEDVQYTHMAYAAGHLLFATAGAGAILSVLCPEDADVGQVGHDMGLLAARVPSALSVARRRTLPTVL